MHRQIHQVTWRVMLMYARFKYANLPSKTTECAIYIFKIGYFNSFLWINDRALYQKAAKISFSTQVHSDTKCKWGFNVSKQAGITNNGHKIAPCNSFDLKKKADMQMWRHRLQLRCWKGFWAISVCRNVSSDKSFEVRIEGHIMEHLSLH